MRRRVGERWKNECLRPSVKHGGGSVLVWGCISASGVGDIVRIEGIMNAEKYRQVLIHHAIASGKCLFGKGFIFQHENDPKHSANAEKSYLERKTAKSPDLNIIQAVWDHLHREKNKRQPKSKEAWYNIPEDYFRKLQDNLPKRVQDVLEVTDFCL